MADEERLKEQDRMREIAMRLKLTDQQWDFLKSLGVEDRDYSQSEIDDVVIDALVGHLMSYGWEKNTNTEYEKTNEIGDMCENIIDAIEEQR